MKTKLALVFALLFAMSLSTYAQEGFARGSYSFDRTRPEFTIRQTTAFYTSGPTITAGANINDWFTAGLGVGHRSTYYDDIPAHDYAYNADIYLRGYLHLDRNHICSLYLDVLGGWNHCYDKTYTISYNTDRTYFREIDGADWYSATFEPGVRVRLYHDLQLFLGLSYTAGRRNAVGFHLGLGI